MVPWHLKPPHLIISLPLISAQTPSSSHATAPRRVSPVPAPRCVPNLRTAEAQVCQQGAPRALRCAQCARVQPCRMQEGTAPRAHLSLAEGRGTSRPAPQQGCPRAPLGYSSPARGSCCWGGGLSPSQPPPGRMTSPLPGFLLHYMIN